MVSAQVSRVGDPGLMPGVVMSNFKSYCRSNINVLGHIASMIEVAFTAHFELYFEFFS